MVEKMPSGQLTVIDLFCGCGGFSLGAHQAGFKVTLSIDVDADLTSTYLANFPMAKVVNGDLSKMRAARVLELAGAKPTGIIGGPPCQGFSAIGKRSPTDERNTLVSRFFYYIQKIEPDFFVFENVPGVLSHPFEELLHAGISRVQPCYRVFGPFKLLASDYGAATRRERVFVVGFKTRFGITRIEEILPKKSSRKTTIRDAIADLPEIEGRSSTENWLPYKTDIPVSTYGRRCRKLPSKNLGCRFARDKLKTGFVSGNIPTEHSLETISRFESVVPGTSDSVSRYPRLAWDSQATTLRAGTGKDRGSYQAARPIHPDQPRVITVREAARIQGFPDWFTFHETKWHSFRMIGNSVSPVIAEKLLIGVKRAILG